MRSELDSDRLFKDNKSKCCVGCVRGGLALIFRSSASVGTARPVTHHPRASPHFPPPNQRWDSPPEDCNGQDAGSTKMPVPPRCPFHPLDQTAKVRCTPHFPHSPPSPPSPHPGSTLPFFFTNMRCTLAICIQSFVTYCLFVHLKFMEGKKMTN